MKKYCLFLLCCLLAGCAVLPRETVESSRWQDRPAAFHDNYKLEEVVVLSRHNIRSPLSGKGSVLSRITPNQWFAWTSAPGELSRKGTVLEAQMGQFFREWMIREGLWEHNAVPAEGEVRFYANSLQRTIATARSFAAAFLPMADVSVEHHYPVGISDLVFIPTVNTDTQDFREEAQRAIEARGGREVAKAVAPQLDYLAKVLDIRHSPAAAHDTLGFRTDDAQFSFIKDKEPSMTGGLTMALLACDALTLQYYEEPDLRKAGFGRIRSREDWEKITAISNWYQDFLFGIPMVAKDVARPLLEELFSELRIPERKFTFLCGHDSNLKSVLVSLDAEPYSLPDAIEKETPIGSKLVICKWRGTDGKLYADIQLVYPSAEQLREMPVLDLQNPPSSYRIRLQGMEPNAEGLYKMEELDARFLEAIEGSRTDSLKVMSYNIRFGTADDGPNSWPLRREAAAAMILDQRPAVFGVQEALPMQLDYLTEACPMYRWVGVGRDNGKEMGEFMSVFYDTTRVSMVEWGTYWLSETPEEPSLGWDAACKRTATWTLLKDRSNGKSFFFVNTHLDHVGVEARKRGLALLTSRIGAMNPEGFPMILCGDFNIYPDNPGLTDLRELMLDARETAPVTDRALTYHGWGTVENTGPIDFIFWRGFSACAEFTRVTQPYLGCTYVSDHYPITAVFTY